MSWFSRPFSMNESTRSKEERSTEEEDDDDEGEELDLTKIASATGKGVKEDLSQLTKTFTRQLWGVASFLAPPPVERPSSGEISASREESVAEKGGDVQVRNSQESESTRGPGGGESFAQVEPGSSAREGVSADALPEKGIPQGTFSPRRYLEQDSLPTTPRGGPRLTGLRSDFAELRGSVATGLSRISSSVIRVVAGDDSGEDDEKEHRVDSPNNVYSPSSSENVDQKHKPPSRGFDAFLKPLLGNMLALEGSVTGGISSDEDDDGVDSDAQSRKSQVEGNSKSRGTESLPSAFASGIDEISKFAVSLLQIVQDEEYEDQEDEGKDNLEAVGVTEAVIMFARSIAMHPETWLDFPLPDDENDEEFEMNSLQTEHTHALELAAPGLGALRIELCPNYMPEERFWKIYFVLLHSRLSSEEAQILSTPQVVKARASLLNELQKRSAHSNEIGANQDHDHGSTNEDVDSVRKEIQPWAGEHGEKVGESPRTSVTAQVALVSSTSEMLSSLSSPSQDTRLIRENVSTADKSKYVSTEVEEEKGIMNPQVESVKEKSRALSLEDDEAEVDEWLDDKPSTKQLGASGPKNHLELDNMDEDVSFSDLEDEDSIQKGDAHQTSITSSYEPHSSTKGSTSAITVKGKGISGSLGQESVADGAQVKSPEKGEDNDWLTVDQDDVVSTDCSSST